MKKTFLFTFAFVYTLFFSQGKIELSYVYQVEDFIEINLKMDKESNKFELIDLDTITVTDHKNNIFKENKEYPINYNYNLGSHKTRRYYIPKNKFKTVDIKGVMKYFTPSKANDSYFDLGTLNTIKRNTNLIDKKITEKNPGLYFSIVDSTVINTIFPDFKYKINDDDDYKKIDFSSFDLLYSYRYNDTQKFMYFINGEADSGYHTLSLKDKTTGIIYKMVKIKKDMTPAEAGRIKIELMIENEKSVKKIPFEMKNVVVEMK